jgi:Zn-dependent M28 family amino/carboxypeptidase
MIRLHTLIIALLVFAACSQPAESVWQPEQKELAGALNFLSSPLLEGRETGERGSLIAAEYIASVMEQIGLEPAGDVLLETTSWFQDFEALWKAKTAASEEKTLAIRNVLGMIKGKDTAKYVVIAAHYDHLGIRNGVVHPGADDNASGVSGMLALAKRWVNKRERPSCTLIFAAWSAEEKSHLGSKYFVQNFAPGKESILLNINFDMISRSDPEDTLGNTLYIGTRLEHQYLKEMIENCNSASGANFLFDYWDTDEDGGSDYASFAEHGIPVLAFYSGTNADYHSPRDTREKVDWAKMIRILKLANSFLENFLERME